METKTAATIDEYIAGFPPEVQAVLEQVRATIRDAAPEAGEAIKYALPTFVLHGNLVHFGAFQRHLGLYPGSAAIDRFRAELGERAGTRGTVRFPYDEPIPYGLIAEIVRFRVAENTARAAAMRRRKGRVTAHA